MWHNLPLEMRQYPNWVVAGADKIPINPRTGKAASVADPSTWATYEEAIRAGYKHIGFVLSDRDPYTIIDLDNKPDNPLTPDKWRLHQQILENFDSYTEKSASGLGYHIICKGRVPSGINSRANSLEMYSSLRFMVCTGNFIPERNLPIKELQEGLDYLYGLAQPAKAVGLEEHEGLLDDRDIVDMACNAVNAQKFNDLCNGKWQEMVDDAGVRLYPSQSEADYALLAMLTFYTPDNEQVRRIFRLTALGQRDKAVRDDKYLNRALQKIRAVQPQFVDFSEVVKNWTVTSPASTPEATGINPGGTGTPPLPANPPITQNSFESNEDTGEGQPHIQGIPLPPGLVGELATYFYQTAVRPVPEIALTSALAFMSGVAGRSYNISGTGLNQYLILLAKTGSGKEGMARGINNLIAALRPTLPTIDDFIGPSAFASGQALIKVLDERPVFVSILGEFGLTLQQICDDKANSALVMLRKVLLDLYSKSGWNDVLQSSVYSDKEKNTQMVQAPCVTILAESTPETFFDGLDASHISEGLIPRFSVVEYRGGRPPRNPNANCPPDPDFVKRVANVVYSALSTSANNTCGTVQINASAQTTLDTFDKECDLKINSSSNDVEVQLWNRAHLKVLKLSAILAVGVNPAQPVVDDECVAWSLDFIRREVTNVATRYKTGDVGKGDGKQNHDIRRIIRDYLKLTYDKVRSYGVEEVLHKEGTIPYVYLQRRTASMSSFRNDRKGASGALKTALQDLIDGGLIQEIPPVQMQRRYSCKGRGFVVTKEFR